MNINDKIDNVKDRKDLIEFMGLLRKDFANNKDNWENADLDSFLEAMEAWTTDMDGYYINKGEVMPDKPTWQMIADILYAATIYE